MNSETLARKPTRYTQMEQRYDGAMSAPLFPLADVLGFEASDKRIDILRRIGQVGSISQAAREAGVSYKAAWQALETLTNLAGTPLVDKAVGGSGGGGAALTAAGQRVLQAADQLAQARQHILTQLAAHAGEPQPGRAALALRTSMRNQFPCVVGTIRPMGGQVRVQLLLADGAPLFSRITRESRELLDLAGGQPVLALCKATAVRVARELPPQSQANLLRGAITRSTRAAAGGEMGLRLDSGVQLVGFAEPGHGLRVGDKAVAAVDEAGVVIASTG